VSVFTCITFSPHHIECTKQHISCFYHLRRLCQIRRQRSRDSSRLPGTDNVEIRLLQFNASRSTTNDDGTTASLKIMRLIFQLGTRKDVTASARRLQLHWLPVRWRVQFKLCRLTHSFFYGRCPAGYLNNIVSHESCRLRASVVLVTVSLERLRAPSSVSAPSHTPARL